MQGSRPIRNETRRTVRRGTRTVEVRVITYPAATARVAPAEASPDRRPQAAGLMRARRAPV